MEIPDFNDHAPLLWNDAGTLRFFFGHSSGSGYTHSPFTWSSSTDHGATWSPLRVVRPSGKAGSFSAQPISTAFRDPSGAMFVSCDGAGGASLLWVSRDEGQTWEDAGGRTHGRHSSVVLLKDGTLFAMGGKNTQIDGHQPQNVSGDQGKSWKASASPFPECGGGQRPSLLRLASGRLFFACDYRASFYKGRPAKPKGIADLGIADDRDASFVTLSDDEGRTWHPWKRLPVNDLRYSAACQSPDGLIHLVTSKPGQLFTMNEAWILDHDSTAAPAETPLPPAEPCFHFLGVSWRPRAGDSRPSHRWPAPPVSGAEGPAWRADAGPRAGSGPRGPRVRARAAS
jgi:hypothetical protein